MNQDSKDTGVVKWFSRTKGFGFITPDDGGKGIFVHYSGIEGEGYRNLSDGDLVSYDRIENNRGPRAINVRVRG